MHGQQRSAAAMFRFKKKHKHLFVYVVALYSFLLLVSLVVHNEPAAPRYEATQFTRLSGEMFVLSAYWEDRFPSSFVRFIKSSFSATFLDKSFKMYK